jgi:hypothetical protein
VRQKIEYRFRVPSAAVFTLYSYSKALEYRFRVPTAGSLGTNENALYLGRREYFSVKIITGNFKCLRKMEGSYLAATCWVYS